MGGVGRVVWPEKCRPASYSCLVPPGPIARKGPAASKSPKPFSPSPKRPAHDIDPSERGERLPLRLLQSCCGFMPALLRATGTRECWNRYSRRPGSGPSMPDRWVQQHAHDENLLQRTARLPRFAWNSWTAVGMWTVVDDCVATILR